MVVELGGPDAVVKGMTACAANKLVQRSGLEALVAMAAANKSAVQTSLRSLISGKQQAFAQLRKNAGARGGRKGGRR